MEKINFLYELYSKSKFTELIEEIGKFDPKQNNMEISSLHVRSLRKLGNYSEAEDVLKSIIIENKDSIIDKIRYYSSKLDLFTHMGRYEMGKQLISDLQSLLNGIDVDKLSPNDKNVIAQSYNELARIHFFLSQYDEAFKYLELELEIAKELDDLEKVATSLTNIGSTYVSIGQYKQAEEYFVEALNIAKKMNSKHLVSHIEDNLGLVYYYQGRLDLAMDALESSLEINKEIQDPRAIGFNYEYIGQIKLKKNNIVEAISNFHQSYEIRKQLGNDNHLASTIFALIGTYIESGEREEAKKCLSEIQEISNRTKILRVAFLSNLAEAIYLKDSKTYKNKAKAEGMLRNLILEGEIPELYYKIQAYLHLIDMLYEQIKELEYSDMDDLVDEEEALFKDIEEFTSIIKEIAENQNLPDLKVSYYNIKGFIAISKLRVQESIEYFETAEELCSTNGLANLKFQFKEIDKPNRLAINKQAFPHKIQTSVNKIIHSLPRLLIITTLLKEVRMTFTELMDRTQMSPGNMGRHTDKLIDSGYLHKAKELIDDKFVTVFSLTPEGLHEFNKYTDILIPFLTSAQATV